MSRHPGAWRSFQTLPFAAQVVATLGLAVVIARVLIGVPISQGDAPHWLTAHALAQTGDFSIGRRIERGEGFVDEGPVAETGAIDVVLDPQSGRFYAMKHPLLGVAAAGVLAAESALTGWSADRLQKTPLGKLPVLLLGVLPFAFYLLFLGAILALLGASRSTSVLFMAAFGFTGFVPSFAAVLAHHAPAAAATAAALWFWASERRGLALGAAAALAGALEPTAMALFGAVACAVVVAAPAHRARFFLGAAPVFALYFALNWASIGTLLPAYAKGGGPWAHFEGSYWASPTGIDVGEPSALRYALHFLVGHHGLFSLTPLLCFGLWALFTDETKRRGAWAWPASVMAAVGLKALGASPLALGVMAASFVVLMGAPHRWWEREEERSFAALVVRWFGAAGAAATTFLIAFTENYGGVTLGIRWLCWLTPLGFLAAWRLFERRRSSAVLWSGAAAVLVGAVSSLYSFLVPYRHPWLYDLWQAWGG